VFRVTPTDITDNEFTVKGLTEGREYDFRVAAVNEAGPGEYAETSQAIKPAPAPCTFSIHVFMLHFLNWLEDSANI